ncbi:alpha/beta fold hydrolase [Rugamonas apoptosis]|uniref:alpha/beta fold hydrolase n=1 Tax=Rugamonas apoptosis TaxID=2758570 RepID=UPI001E653C46|nr:alpha/beta fold hydrolase [Rugamonas apoptosis]
MPNLSTRKVKVGGRCIQLSEAGEGPPVLMLHGGGPGASGVSNYTRNIAALARHFRVLVPDMPGYGQSTKGIDRSDPFGDLAGSMAGLLDALRIERTHLIGNSLGGACALRLTLDHPDRAARLVLMGPGGVDTTRSLPTPGLKRLLDYYNGDGPSMDKLTRFIRGDLVYDGTQVDAAVIAERYRSSVDPQVVAAPPLRRPAGWPKFRKLDFTRDPRLQQCDTPTLVLWGTEDKVNRPSGAQSLQKRMRRCDVHLFSETGHWVQWERAAQFNAVTSAFLLEHGAAPARQP